MEKEEVRRLKVQIAAQLAEVTAERAELKETAGRLQRQVEQQRQSLAKNRVSCHINATAPTPPTGDSTSWAPIACLPQNTRLRG